MPSESSSDVKLEIGHVLFIDIVGYSKLLIDQQTKQLETLKAIVRGTEQVKKAEAEGKLLRLPTGDGGALVFRTSPEAPVLCAMEIAKALKSYPALRVRMGIHSGPVNEITDLNEQANIAGAGINIAQRVMDCGDAGHILLSRHVAEDLEHYPRWQPFLHVLGEADVKHGLHVRIVNLYRDGIGNLQTPNKLLGLRKHRSQMRWGQLAAALLVLAVVVAAFVVVSRQRERSTATVPNKSIAVLPFENLSSDKENAYFAEGIQDELLTRVSKIADLKVISRTSTRQYQSKPGNLREIANQLGVANILEGSVQKAGDQVRVNVQLVNAETDFHLWAETYDRKLTDIFGVESEIAKRIAESLQAKLTGREEQALAVKPTNNPEAYDAYLRGLAFDARAIAVDYSDSRDLAGKAIGFYERAVELDPKFALAWARLSRADALLYFNRNDSASAARGDAAKRALENAQKLEPNSPETLLGLGYYQYWVLRDYEAAKNTFGRVNKMLRSGSEVLYALALIGRREGHWDQSVDNFERALTLDPRNVDLLTAAAETYGVLRQFPAALKLYDRALDITPNDPDVLAAKAGIYQACGNLQEAARLLSGINEQTPFEDAFEMKITQLRLERNYRQAIRLLQARLAQFHFASPSDKGGEQVTLAFMQRLAGDMGGAKATAEQARTILEPLFRDQPDNYLVIGALSQVYAVMGQKESALKAAERAITLLPSAIDARDGPLQEENLALIQTIFGENSRAISTLIKLLRTPYLMPITPALLRLDPIWDPLRGDPRFEKLVSSLAPKETK
ncbi:MAG TPA: tetratricopeptide repeat protein [Candidatus Udaeobacter sp.]|jgi:TolB-like protein/Tfp pilus assembly protein PilF